MAVIEVKNIAKKFANAQNQLEAIKSISFAIEEREFVSLVGPNGSGKSTLFNLLLGILKPDKGQISITPTSSRFGFVFQNYRDSLMPWASVIDNVILPLEEVKIPQADKIKKARAALKKLGLAKFEGAYVYEISGGMAQLVVLARAMITEPDILLLDEPFSALDYQRSLQTQQMLASAWEQRPMATFMISHDIDEAIFMSDKIIVLSPRPSQVKEVVEIKLPRPRTFESRVSPEFEKYRAKILKIIESNEVTF